MGYHHLKCSELKRLSNIQNLALLKLVQKCIYKRYGLTNRHNQFTPFFNQLSSFNDPEILNNIIKDPIYLKNNTKFMKILKNHN